jgi:type 1 glutamine amidotransferase
MSEVNITDQFVLITCYKSDCGISWAMPKSWDKHRLDDHKTFYCPNGHTQGYVVKSDSEKLKEEIEGLNKRLEDSNWWRNHLERSRRSYKAQITKIKKRGQR